TERRELEGLFGGGGGRRREAAREDGDDGGGGGGGGGGEASHAGNLHGVDRMAILPQRPRRLLLAGPAQRLQGDVGRALHPAGVDLLQVGGETRAQLEETLADPGLQH